MARFAIRNVTKILQSASGRLFGRLTAGDGPGEELTPTQVRSLCSVYSTSEVDAIAAAKVSAASLALGTTGSDLNWSSTTLNVPDAGASARGVVTTGTQTIAGAKTFSNDVTIGANRYLKEGSGGEILAGRDGSGFYYAVGFTAHSSPVYIGTTTASVTLPSNKLLPSSAALTLSTVGFGVLCPGALTVGGTSSAKNIVIDTTAAASVYGIYLAYSGTNRVALDANGSTGEVRIGALGGSYFPVLYSNGTACLSFTTAGAATFHSSVSVTGAFNFPPITKAALLATTPTAATAGTWRITDSTPANRTAYPDGTNWRYNSDDTIVV